MAEALVVPNPPPAHVQDPARSCLKSTFFTDDASKSRNHPPYPQGRLMRIHNIYADENGETHFRDIDVEWTTTGADGTTSKRFPATGIMFRNTPATGAMTGTLQ